jgi:hypothetical protein
VSRDTLNPLLNTTILKERLAKIEYYKHLHGEMYARWPHYWMGRTANQLWKYKFNLAIKGCMGYMIFREVQNYRNLKAKTVMTYQQGSQCFANIGMATGAFTAVCLLI